MNGGGHNVQDIGVPEEWEALQHWEHVLLIINVTGVSVVKISVSLALLRFLRGRWYQIFLKSLIGKLSRPLSSYDEHDDTFCGFTTRPHANSDCSPRSVHHRLHHHYRGASYLPMLAYILYLGHRTAIRSLHTD